MSEKVLITKEKIDNVANKILDITGETSGKTLDELNTTLTNVNNEITTQEELIAQLQAAVDSLPEAGSSGIDTSDATATNATILSGYTAYVKGEKITGTIETKTFSDLTSSDARVTIPAGYYASTISKSVSTATQATPSITVSSSGLITASARQTAGYVTAGTKNATKQLTTKAATTYTPGTSNQTIAASTYLTGVQTIKGDSNLVASNIKSGTSIFGVTGTYEGSGGGGSLETCTVTFTPNSPAMGVFIVTYMNSSSQIVTTKINASVGGSITCLKNSIITVQNRSSMDSLSGGLSEIFYAQSNWAIQVSSDGTFYIEG